MGAALLGRIVEMTVPFDPVDFFPGTTEAQWDSWRQSIAEGGVDLETGRLLFTIQSFVIETRWHKILVDTCIGNDKNRPRWNGAHLKRDEAYLTGMASLGFAPDDIDFVLCTHLHGDHVGWNTRLLDGRWVPTFPKARYVLSKLEVDTCARHPDSELDPPLLDSVLPVVAAGQAELVGPEYVIDDEVRLEPAPGHTLDHRVVRINSRAQSAVICGDLMHTPLQCAFPEWSCRADSHPGLAAQTRRSFLERSSNTDVLVCAAHFPLPSAGRVIRHSGAFRFDFEAGDGW